MYVSGHIHEQVPRVLIPAVSVFERAPYPVGKSASVGVKEPASEFTWMAVHDLLLPGFEPDRAFMFPARSVLREQTRPVFRAADDVDAALFVDCHHRVIRAHG
jgi:hypothetical protein